MSPRRPPSPGVPIAQRGPGWSSRPDHRPPSLFAAHQPGIATPPLEHVLLAAFDLRGEAAGLLRTWTQAAQALLADDRTVTFGLGAGAFTPATRPVALRPLPPFPGDALEPARCGGDLAVQICAARSQDADAALEGLRSVAADAVALRWRQAGSLLRDPRDRATGTPRDPLGFRDGTHNLRRDRDLERHVWVARGDRSGMVGGTYLVIRRIELDLRAWDAVTVAEQERVIGRHRGSGAPLGGRHEFDPAPLEAFPPDSHVRLASPRTGPSPPMLRRSYPSDEGLLFLAFMRDPARQFVPVQRRLATHDPLSRYARHTGSAVFAVPPGARAGGFVGDRLLGAR